MSDGYDEGELAGLDLGPAPPPGSSRLLARAEVEAQLRAAGDDAKSLRMPGALRVKSASKRWSPEELRDALTPKLLAALPLGLTLKAAKLNRSIVTSPSVVIGAAHFPKFPKREGELTLTASVDLEQDGVTVMRVPVTVVVLVSEAATHATASKGARVKLVIAHGPARVSALATALSDTELGELGMFRVIEHPTRAARTAAQRRLGRGGRMIRAVGCGLVLRRPAELDVRLRPQPHSAFHSARPQVRAR